ncbi:MAG: hypothetical protein LBJ22_03990 [Synergistaceae bacterium]|jgi:hypothetical protein|nr:hypothetical protein [Synergistaceae bacterium]
MKKLVAAIVLMGALSVASGAMAHENERRWHDRPRGGRGYLEYTDRDSGFGMWLSFPRPGCGMDRRHQEWGRGKPKFYHHDRHGHPRFRHWSGYGF